jgi:hypothetical protein
LTFSWASTKDGRVRVSWRGKVVTTLAGGAAARFLEQAEGAEEEAEQLLMARATGNFKRGNERRSAVGWDPRAWR